jgi:hypothetical protein
MTTKRIVGFFSKRPRLEFHVSQCLPLIWLPVAVPCSLSSSGAKIPAQRTSSRPIGLNPEQLGWRTDTEKTLSLTPTHTQRETQRERGGGRGIEREREGGI